MANQSYYEGRGGSQTAALADLRNNARDAVSLEYEGVEYTCTIRTGDHTYKGATGTDYGVAFALALEAAKMKTSDLKQGQLEVLVLLPKPEASIQQARPTPSGPDAHQSSGPKDTDLF